MDKCNTEPDVNESSAFNNAIKVIINEMKKKDKIIASLKQENELLKMQLQELYNNSNFNNYNNNKNSNQIYYNQLEVSPPQDNQYYNVLNEQENKQFISAPSFSNANMGFAKNSLITKMEIKQFLQEVKGKIPADIFKKFIGFVKVLTAKNKDKANVHEKQEVLTNIKELLVDYPELYERFEEMVTIK